MTAGPGDHVLRPVPATAVAAADVIVLLQRIWVEYDFVWDPETEFPDLFTFDAHYALPRGAFWVVRDELGRVVGSIGVQRVNATTAEIRRLYLDKHLRGRGLGRALVEEVLAWCRAHRYTRLVLWSDPRFAHSPQLYDRMGLARVGERTVPDDLNNSREYRFERDV